MERSRLCTDCKFCLRRDTGYSNYTVTGFDINCLKNLNKDFPVDEFYGKDDALLFANQCDSFVSGGCVNVDVDMEDGMLEDYSYDEEVKALLREW